MLGRQNDGVYYWQDKSEVDFAVRRREELYGINVTFGPSVPEREVKGLLEFRKSHNRVKKLLLITKETKEKRGPLRLIPLWEWLLDF